jgi:hypothetical protein
MGKPSPEKVQLTDEDYAWNITEQLTQNGAARPGNTSDIQYLQVLFGRPYHV